MGTMTELMVKCQICGKEYKNYKSLGIHVVKGHKIYKKNYYDKYIKKDPNGGTCPECGKETNFKNLSDGYYRYCSLKCSNNSEETKEKYKKTCLEKYGSESSNQSEEIKEKIKLANLEKYGVLYPSQSPEIREKQKQTCLERYGVKYPSQNLKIRKRQKQTCLEKYGVEYAFQSEEIRNKSKQTCLKNHGVEYPQQSSEIREKTKQTLFKKYGVEHASQSPEIKEKKVQNYFKKTGYYYSLENPEIRKKCKKTMIKKYGVEYPMQSEENRRKIKINYRNTIFNRLLSNEKILSNVTPLFKKKEYDNRIKKYPWLCNICGNEFKDDLDNGHIPRCLICHPIMSGYSNLEKEISEFCKQFYPNLIENDRNILNGMEIDIYIPEINLAIEFNGLYWHSDLQGKNLDYHINKMKQCQNKNIQLIHIFEDEWYDKQEIVQSILKAKMNVISNIIYARKCEIFELNNNLSEDFLDTNHIQGSHFGKSYGLIYNNELVSIFTIGKSRFNKNYEWEIYRFCNKLDTIVIGGFSKLLKAFIEDKSPKSIITYADRRYSTGNLYSKNGLRLINESEPNYYYMKNYLIRESRQKYQKHKLQNILETFDPELTEWENMQLNGYDRIWDCGNLVFGMNLGENKS